MQCESSWLHLGKHYESILNLKNLTLLVIKDYIALCQGMAD